MLKQVQHDKDSITALDYVPPRNDGVFYKDFEPCNNASKNGEWRTLVYDFLTSDKSFKDNIALFYIKQNYNDRSTIC
ncbi:hypothetical protein [Rickettsia endosymbiont of Orchestes rusci]|uniref:hypothetical protein n=1 Tax=Rickettsia endosymbiont of Orchestes rusci TaxID=3066250 RepID=UPI00313DD8B3